MAERNEKNTGYENDAVAELLGGLKRIETPNDFSVRVRARIAERKAERRAPSMVRILKLISPAAALILLGAFLYLGGIFTSDVTDLASVPPVAENNRAQSPPITGLDAINTDIGTNKELVAVNANTGGVNSSVIAQANDRTTSNVPQRSPSAAMPVRESSPTIPGPGSSVSRAATVPAPPIRPPGLSPNNAQTGGTRPAGLDGGGSLNAVDLISLFGAETDLTGDGMIVRSVAANGIAERSGIKPGDVIILIDGETVNGASRFDGGKTYRTVSITRDGRRIDLEIRNR